MEITGLSQKEFCPILQESQPKEAYNGAINWAQNIPSPNSLHQDTWGKLVGKWTPQTSF